MAAADSEPSAGPADLRLAAHLLATAIEEADDGRVKEALAHAARRLGEVVGHDLRSRAGVRHGFEACIGEVEEVLRAYGFDPGRHGEEVRLRRCPFHALVQEHMVLVCGVNVAFLDGLVVALEASGIDVRLDPVPGRCCVVLAAAGTYPQYAGG